MQIRVVVSTLALATSTLAPLTSSAASLFRRDGNTPSAAVKTAKAKMVRLTLKNLTAEPMVVIVNDQALTLAANGQADVKVAENSNILADDRNTVKLHVTRELGDNTVSFR